MEGAGGRQAFARTKVKPAGAGWQAGRQAAGQEERSCMELWHETPPLSHPLL